jgi:hypothetical protein
MQIPRLSKWLWLAIIVDVGILVRSISFVAVRTWALLPYRSATEWASEPDMLLDLLASCAGFVGVFMMMKGDRKPLLFWNLCYLAILVTHAFSSPLHIAILFNQFGTSFEPALMMAATVTATIAVALSN